MRPVTRADKIPRQDTPEDDPCRYGWRYVRRLRPDGKEVIEEVPLREEDLLYPEEGDFVVYEPIHTRDFIYCQSTLEAFYASQPNVVVLGDCRVDWGIAGVRPLGPDVLVLFDVPQWQRRATFRLAEESGRPVLVLEIASPNTRKYDLGIKRTLYYRVGVQKYVIVDRGPQNDAPARLRGYQRGPTGWRLLRPDAEGRLDLAPVAFRLGIADDRPWLYDATTGVRAPDRTELQQALTGAETRAREAEAQVREAAQARAALEAQVRALEEMLRHQQG